MKKIRFNSKYVKLATPILILLGFLNVFYVWFISYQDLNDKADVALELEVQSVINSLNHELERYEDLALSAQAFYQSSNSVSREEWKTFSDAIDLQNNYAGISSLTYISILEESELDGFIQKVRSDDSIREGGYPNAEISPRVQGKDAYYVVEYIEPGDDSRINAIGSDQGTETSRATTIEKMLQTKESALTPKIIFRNNQLPGILMYSPLLNDNNEVEAIVAITFRVNDLFEYFVDTYDINNKNLGIAIYEDTEKTVDDLLYSYDPVNIQNPVTTTFNINFVDKEWSVSYTVPEYYGLDAQQKSFPLFAAAITALVYILVIGLTLYVQKSQDIAVEEYKKAEDDLKETQDKFKAIFDNAIQFIGLMELDGTLTEVNKTVREFGDFEKDELIGKKIWETPFFKQDEKTQKEVKDNIRKAAAGEVVKFDMQIKNKDGQTIEIDMSIKPVFDENGIVTMLIPEGRDVSQSKDIQEELKDRNLQLEKFNEILVNREMKMLELKKQIKELGGEQIIDDNDNDLHPSILEAKRIIEQNTSDETNNSEEKIEPDKTEKKSTSKKAKKKTAKSNKTKLNTKL